MKDDQIELEKFFQDYSQMQQNQLTPQTLREAIKYKEDLEKAGFNLPALPQLKSLATKYGDPEKVLNAIESYEDLNIINKNLETTKHELEDAEKLLKSVDSQLKRHQDLEQLSKALITNYHELQEALTNGTKNISTDLAGKLDAVTKSFENETKQKLTQFSTQYTNEIKDQIGQIDAAVTSLRTKFEDNVTTLQAAIANGIKSANTLSETYGTLQEALQSAINKLPDDLKTDLTKAANEFRTETKRILSETAKDFKNETGKNLQQINDGINNINKQINEKSETLSTKIEDATTKATVAITNLASLATDIVSKDQNQYRKSLESIQQETVQRLKDVKTTLDTLTTSFDERKQTLIESVNQSILIINQNIEALSNRAVEAGEKFKEIELRYAESKPYMELLQMTKDPTTTTPHVLATLKTILDAFQRWLKTNPQTVTNPNYLSITCAPLLTQLKQETPDS